MVKRGCASFSILLLTLVILTQSLDSILSLRVRNQTAQLGAPHLLKQAAMGRSTTGQSTNSMALSLSDFPLIPHSV
jgi:hypothetical protein